MPFYTNMGAVALDLLTKFGTSIILNRTVGNSVDPITGVVVSGVDASVTTTGLVRPYPDKVIDGKRILVGDRELVLSNEQVPQPSDRVVLNGEEWSIVGVKTIQPDTATTVVYFAQVRR